MQDYKIENVSVCVTRMEESNGNVQFFLRAVRTDVSYFNMKVDSLLEYSCFQTKTGLTINECIERAVFESQFLLRFFGLEKSDLILQRFSCSELKHARSIHGYADCIASMIQPEGYKYYKGVSA